MQALDFTWDPNKTYTFWSGLIGGLFLMLSYFGCDQSQVQRYLTAKSVDEGRQSLLMSAYFKIPLQFLIPMIGVLIFVFYLFHQPPVLFNHQHDAEVRASARAGEYRGAGAGSSRRRSRPGGTPPAALAAARRTGRRRRRSAPPRPRSVRAEARVAAIRGRATALVREVTGDAAFGDVNYVFPTFVTEHMPIGLVGLIIAAIFAAAMSSIAAELNSLSTATVIDFYRRLWRTDASDAHYLTVSKLVTGFWGLVACVVAIYATNLGPLIDVVNRFGSFFYGSLLGVFVLAIGTKRATSRGAFWGLLAGMAAVALVAQLHRRSRSSGTTSSAPSSWSCVGLLISLLDRSSTRKDA